MGRRQTVLGLDRCQFPVLFLFASVSGCLAYFCFLILFKPSAEPYPSRSNEHSSRKGVENEEGRRCCRGIEHLELWGDAVKWGSDFKVNSSEQCCMACKEMCTGVDGPCLCNSWVFCGSKEACGSRFGECWLKKQMDILDPDRREFGEQVMWTSGLILGPGEGIVELRTELGILHVKLLPDCAPHSVRYILELLATRHCAGCQFYRAESRGRSWDSGGNHVHDASFGPPFALIQGTLEAHGVVFKGIQAENCPTIRRGAVAWVGSGPEFFISLANHQEWIQSYTVFGYVFPEDMDLVERIAQLKTVTELWGNVNVSVLERPLPFKFQRVNKSLET